jgi:dihydrofolate reductase
VKLYIASSLDGFIARKDGTLDWLTDLSDPGGSDHGYAEFYETIDTVIMGRKTYEEVVGFDVDWPYGDSETYVVSRSPGQKIKTDNTRLVSGEIVETLSAMKKSEGKDIWLVGGGELVSLCMQHQLVDEIILSIAPIILGDGIQLFPEITSEVKLTLEAVKTFSSGIVTLTYEVNN